MMDGDHSDCFLLQSTYLLVQGSRTDNTGGRKDNRPPQQNDRKICSQKEVRSVCVDEISKCFMFCKNFRP